MTCIVSDLSTSTITRNAELETRLADLEVELSVWKHAHANALDVSERQLNAHNVQMSTLNRQISSLESFKVRVTSESIDDVAVKVLNGFFRTKIRLYSL